jgi:hypothetical protein
VLIHTSRAADDTVCALMACGCYQHRARTRRAMLTLWCCEVHRLSQHVLHCTQKCVHSKKKLRCALAGWIEALSSNVTAPHAHARTTRDAELTWNRRNCQQRKPPLHPPSSMRARPMPSAPGPAHGLLLLPCCPRIRVTYVCRTHHTCTPCCAAACNLRSHSRV